MFDRARHARIAEVLEALDVDLLMSCSCYFGGGTAITLKHGEYRESDDIDFLVSSRTGYGDLRERVLGPQGFNALTSHPIPIARQVLADRYGIRTVLDVGGEPIKFEIVVEGRIELETPGSGDNICGVATLTELDMAASKLLANSDRWADRAVFSRDVIDLAMMEPDSSLLGRAVAKAETAYRSSIVNDLRNAIEYLRDNPHRLDECMYELRMHAISKAALWDRIRRLDS